MSPNCHSARKSALATCLVMAAMTYGGTAMAEGGHLAWFANEAYSKAPRNSGNAKIVYRGGNGELTIWRTDEPGTYPNCTIAWRGSTGWIGVSKDWRANEWSQFTPLAKISGAPAGVYGGRGFVSRFNAYAAQIKKYTTPCKVIDITGHSLGGALAVITRASLGKGNLEAYNPAAPGNAALANLVKQAGGKGYCRKGDPVPSAPVGNASFCNQSGARKYTILFWKNHDMKLWPLWQIQTNPQPIPLALHNGSRAAALNLRAVATKFPGKKGATKKAAAKKAPGKKGVTKKVRTAKKGAAKKGAAKKARAAGKRAGAKRRPGKPAARKKT